MPSSHAGRRGGKGEVKVKSEKLKVIDLKASAASGKIFKRMGPNRP
jgi:hypothetical protein